MKKFLFITLLINFLSPDLWAQQPVLQWGQQKARSIGKIIEHNSEGNIVVCGTYGNDFAVDWVNLITIMYDTNGTELWSQIYDDTVNGGIDEPFDMVIDTFDNVYIAGRTHRTNDGLPITPEALLLKYDKYGNFLWKQEFNDSLGLEGGARRMKLYQNRDIYIAGYMDSISGSNNKSFLAKYDSSGQFHWAFVDTNSYETIGRDVEVDRNGNVYLTGTSACCTPGYKMYATRFDSSGIVLWNTVLYDSAHIYAYTWESTMDDSANIYLTAETQDTSFSTGYDCAVVKVDSSGNQKWFTVYNSSINSDFWEESKDIVVDRSYNLYVVGWVNKSQNNDAFIFQIKSTGNITWDNIYNGSGNDDDGFNSIILDPEENLLVTGGATILPLTGGLILISYDTLGTEIWRIEKQGPYDGNNSMYVNRSLYVTGDNQNIDPFLSDDSLFIFKYGDSMLTNITPGFYLRNFLTISPNPFEKSFFVIFNDIENQSVNFKIYDSQGRVVINRNISNNERISTEGWSKGIYIVELKTDNTIITKKIIKH